MLARRDHAFWPCLNIRHTLSRPRFILETFSLPLGVALFAAAKKRTGDTG